MGSPELDPVRDTSLTELRVRFGETDLMGIVHHATYLAYFEAGRIEWLRRRGVTYADWARGGLHLPVVEAGVRYRAPARFDDLLVVETRLANVRSHSVRFEYALRRDGTLLCEGFTRLACVDDGHALRQLSDEMIATLVGGERA